MVFGIIPMASGIISAGLELFSNFSPSAIMPLGIEKLIGSHLGSESNPVPLYLRSLDKGHPTKFRWPRAFISASKLIF